MLANFRNDFYVLISWGGLFNRTNNFSILECFWSYIDIEFWYIGIVLLNLKIKIGRDVDDD